MTNNQPRLTMPVLAPPIRRDAGQTAVLSRPDGTTRGVLATADPCASLHGLAQQMCYAQSGVIM